MGYRAVAIDNRPAGRRLATEIPSPALQPDLVIDSTADNATDQIYNFTHGEGLAAAVVCTDSLDVNSWALRLLRIRGTLVPLGLPLGCWRFNADVIVFRELVIKGSYVASRESTERMLQVVDKSQVRSHLTLVPWRNIPSLLGMYTDRSFKGRLVVKITD
jgi:D-arabinose 1-dehydrogenase-like Zn-dependent alcohol dehydrogenase